MRKTVKMVKTKERLLLIKFFYRFDRLNNSALKFLAFRNVNISFSIFPKNSPFQLSTVCQCILLSKPLHVPTLKIYVYFLKVSISKHNISTPSSIHTNFTEWKTGKCWVECEEFMLGFVVSLLLYTYFRSWKFVIPCLVL